MRRREPLSSCLIQRGNFQPLGVIPSMQAPPSLREKPQLELWVVTNIAVNVEMAGHVAGQKSLFFKKNSSFTNLEEWCAREKYDDGKEGDERGLLETPLYIGGRNLSLQSCLIHRIWGKIVAKVC